MGALLCQCFRGPSRETGVSKCTVNFVGMAAVLNLFPSCEWGGLLQNEIIKEITVFKFPSLLR